MLRVYMLLARLLLPHSFVQEFGADLFACVDARLKAAKPGRMRLFTTEIMDLLRTAGREWATRIADQVVASERGRVYRDPRRPTVAANDRVQRLVRPNGELTRSRDGILSVLVHDLRTAARTLRRRTGFTMVAVVAIALGIGAATAMFSVVDGVLLRPLGYEDPGRLVTVWYTYPHWRGNAQLGDRWDRMALPYPSLIRLRTESTRLEEIAAYKVATQSVTGIGLAEAAAVGEGSANLMSTLRIRPLLGRWFLPGEEGKGSPRLAVLSEQYWRSRFGGDAEVLGRVLRLGGEPYQIVGVVPRAVRLHALMPGAQELRAPQVWIPIGATGHELSPFSYEYETIGRLPAGTTVDQALAEAEPVLRGDANPAERGARILPRHEAETGAVRTPLLFLLGAVGLLLLVSCGNVAALLLAEAPSREAEMVTRAVLGAGRARLFRQLLTEHLLLALAGCAVGVLIGHAGTRLLVAFAPAELPRIEEIGTNGRVLVFAITAAVITGIGFGLFPSLSLARPDSRVLRSGRGATRRAVVQKTLLTAQMAFCTMLLIAAGLLLRSLHNESSVVPGFRTERLLTLRIDASARDLSPRQQAALLERVLSAVGALPGVDAVSATKTLAFSGRRQSWTVYRPDRNSTEEVLNARRQAVLPGFTELMRIHLLAGRSLLPRDALDAPGVALVNESMARALWPDRSPLGRAFETPNGPLTVVGVVADTRDEALDLQPQPTFFASWWQRPEPAVSIVIATRGDPVALKQSVERAIRALDPDLPVVEIATLQDLMYATLQEERYRSIVLTAFAVIASLLGAVGIGGVTARAVAQRSREIGIRAAIGARPSRLVRDFAGRLLPSAALGVALGCVGALTIRGILAAYLFGVAADDAATYLAVGASLLCTALIAAVVPARRAASVDAARVLRE